MPLRCRSCPSAKKLLARPAGEAVTGIIRWSMRPRAEIAAPTGQ